MDIMTWRTTRADPGHTPPPAGDQHHRTWANPVMVLYPAYGYLYISVEDPCIG